MNVPYPPAGEGFRAWPNTMRDGQAAISDVPYRWVAWRGGVERRGSSASWRKAAQEAWAALLELRRGAA